MARIGILTSLNSHERNMENVLYQVGRSLVTKHSVDLLGPRKTSERIRKHFAIFSNREGPFLFRLPILGPFLRRICLLRCYVRKTGADILMAISSIGMNGLCVAIAGRLEGVPSIVRVTSDIFVVHKHKGPLGERFRLFLKNNVAGRVAIFIADRTVLLHETQIIEMTRKGFSRERFYVVSQPISFPSTEKDSATNSSSVRERFGIPQEAYVVGCVGRLEKDKNIRLLGETANYVLQRDPNVNFLVLGEGREKRWLEKTLAGRQAFFAGQVSHEELPAYYRAFNATLHTSHSEGLCNVIAESLYFGVPVVSTDSGAITRELVSNIGTTAQELSRYLLHRHAALDPLPGELRNPMNRELWLKLIEETLNKRKDKYVNVQ